MSRGSKSRANVKPRLSSFRAIAASSKSVIWLRTLSRSSGSAITSGVSPARLRRGATGTPALLRRAIARRERPPPAIGIEAKSRSEFRAEEVPLLIVDPPGQGRLPPWLRRTNVWLRVTSPPRRAKRPRRSKFTGGGGTISCAGQVSQRQDPLAGRRCRLLLTVGTWCPLRAIQRAAAEVA